MKVSKKAWLISLIMTCSSVAVGHATKKANQLFQVATISSLTQGVYDGDVTYQQLKQHGDQGLGTFENLDGEMVALNGHFYQINAKGKLHLVSPQAIVPFAEVSFFKPQIKLTINNIDNYQHLIQAIAQQLPNKNIPYAIQISGHFSYLKLRSLRKQNKPYPKLIEAAKHQAIFNLKNTDGTIVGFWFPKYWSGIGVPGFHLHFVNEKRTLGGHVLEIQLKHTTVQLQPIYSVSIHLPATHSFAKADLASPKLHQSIRQAEGGGE